MLRAVAALSLAAISRFGLPLLFLAAWLCPIGISLPGLLPVLSGLCRRLPPIAAPLTGLVTLLRIAAGISSLGNFTS